MDIGQIYSMPTKKIDFMQLPLALQERAAYRFLALPYEETTSYLKGTSKAPEAVINESHNVEPFDLGVNAASRGIKTQWLNNPEEYNIEGQNEGRSFDVIVGGEHTLTYYTALKHEINTLFIFDAHLDLYNEYNGKSLAHATWLRRYIEEKPGVEVYVFGVRVGSEDEFIFANNNGVKINDALLPKGKKIYLSVDVDALDISAMPCTSNPEPAGLSWETLFGISESLFSRNNIVAADVVEHKPCKELPQFSYAVAKLIYRLFSLKEKYRG